MIYNYNCILILFAFFLNQNILKKNSSNHQIIPIYAFSCFSQKIKFIKDGKLFEFIIVKKRPRLQALKFDVIKILLKGSYEGSKFQISRQGSLVASLFDREAKKNLKAGFENYNQTEDCLSADERNVRRQDQVLQQVRYTKSLIHQKQSIDKKRKKIYLIDLGQQWQIFGRQQNK